MGSLTFRFNINRYILNLTWIIWILFLKKDVKKLLMLSTNLRSIFIEDMNFWQWKQVYNKYGFSFAIDKVLCYIAKWRKDLARFQLEFSSFWTFCLWFTNVPILSRRIVSETLSCCSVISPMLNYFWFLQGPLGYWSLVTRQDTCLG